MTFFNPGRFYHVEIESKKPTAHFISTYNLTEQQLDSRVLSPYNKGKVTTIRGVSVWPSDIVRISIYETQMRIQPAHPDKRVFETLQGNGVRDFTDVFIKGPPGWDSDADVQDIQEVRPNADVREVFVVHGRNMSARDALFEYLRAIACFLWNGPRQLARRARHHHILAKFWTLLFRGLTLLLFFLLLTRRLVSG